MKITFEVPDWVTGKHIYIFANEELLAYSLYIIEKNPKKEYYTPLKVKTQRCNGCGVCCENGSPYDDSDEPCKYLGLKGCELGAQIPFSCARSNCSKTFEQCSEVFK